jgi:histidinol phosphatase-like PHP family hydrolase
MTRRTFITTATAAGAALLLRAEEKTAAATGLDFPLMDFHVHLDKSTIDAVLALPQARGVKFGIVEHAGTKENDYPIVLSNDEELNRYLDMLAGKPVFRGVQAEWIDWTSGFSTKALAKLDYVLTDTMTFPGKDGRRTKLWLKDVESLVEMTDKQAFMDRFVDWHVKVISEQPIDILANTSWLPAPLASDYDAFWTPARVQKVVDAAVKHRVALEISSSYKLPRLPFLKIAKAAGVKFSFGSNGRYPKMGLLDYSIATAKELGLKRGDMFAPAPDGQKAVQRWKRA